MLANIELRHHVLLTEPGAEFKARDHLRHRGFDPCVPEETKIVYRSVRSCFGTQRRKTEVTRPIFRGYIFVPLNMAWSFGPLYTTPGLRQSPFLMICGKPAVLPMHDLERAQSTEIRLKDAPIQGLPYKVGDQVRIIQGPFSGMEAQIAKLDDEARIELLMDLLGARVKAHVSAGQFEAID